MLLPSSAFRQAREIAAQALEDMARAIPPLFEGFERGLSEGEAHRLQDGIGGQLTELLAATAEAERERPLRLAADPLTGPLFRAVLRLRHDLVIMGRAAHVPLPDLLRASLLAPLASAGAEAKGALRASAAALLSRKPAPSNGGFDAAFKHVADEIEALRRTGKLRELSGEAVEHVFAAGFALEQLHHDHLDLNRCIDEWARHRE